ncbi:hypothetical protein A2572_02850 [Candidatus Collierbacteria bacterium RIFOXYD1_FULL_40_9]|uniref:Uncharacterized protein n=1 Tax=Candidatus Collierbacteria bacterium RIFOXYD1_FULL_40_9 TaxID=1817731 RepID=A0A1F5FU19_9BACT|nr:MAG: hypothetical protein A2572_02850 [Candidatus Collierbacteria bacterium RIFOXYD1_FULL_40_9]
MRFWRRTTLIDRTHTFLKNRIVKDPKNNKQIKKDWQFTLINGKINVYGEHRQAFGDMDKRAEIIVITHMQIKILYTSKLSTEDIALLKKALQSMGRNLFISHGPLVTVDIEKLLK